MYNKKFFYLIFLLPIFLYSQDKYDNKYYLIPKTDTITFQMEEVVVTGTRTFQKIIDIPYSVNFLSNVEYKFDKKTSINDVMKFVPGVFMQSRYGNHDVRISIRGFGSRSNSGIRGVRILLDGIPESEPDGQTRIEAIDFNSVGRIEIVKGNSSSLYTTAPGGVVNFINNVYSPQSYIIQYNELGSFGLRRNGFKMNLISKNSKMIMAYTYHNYEGYREHSNDYWNILNTVAEIIPDDKSRFELFGYFVSGMIKLPGSLTLSEFNDDPFQAALDEKNYDYKRITKKGRIGLRYNRFFGENNKNEIELISYGTIKYFERTDKRYRIINRYGLGGTAKYVNREKLFGNKNEFTFGLDLFYQAGPIEIYKNISGMKSDELRGINDETISNSGIFIQNIYTLIPEKFSFLLSGRYDNVVFYSVDRQLEMKNSKRIFSAFTPKVGLNYKLTSTVALYGSFGYSFDVPAGNELDNFPTSSDNGAKLINPDLQPQKSVNLEMGIKGHLKINSLFLDDHNFDLTLFSSVIRDEIVPFEVFGRVYYRNAAKTWRRGIEFGSDSKIYGGVRLKSSYTFSYFKYVEYNALSIKEDLSKTSENFGGNFVPSVPKHNLNLALTYEKSLLNNLDIFSKVSFQYVSGLYTNDKNSEQSDAYNLWNYMIGLDYRLGTINLILSGGINNIFNKIYAAFININSTTGRFYELGEPRIYYLNLNLAYNFN